MTSARRYIRRKLHLFDLRNEVAGHGWDDRWEIAWLPATGRHYRFARPSAEKASGRRVGPGLAWTMSGMDAAT